MPNRPRLVHRPRFIDRAAVERQQPIEEVARPGVTPARELAWPEAAGMRDAMREVEIQNIHPLRLRLLLEIERTRSISTAAQGCGIGQPSGSMPLRNLEVTLGHRLVTRNGRGSRLTAAGKVVASHAARILAALDSIRATYRAVAAWEFNSYEAIIRAVKEGPGVSFVSRLLVSEEIEREELIAFRVSVVEQMLRPSHVVQSSARELASAFMTLLAESAAENPHWAPAGPVSRPAATGRGVAP